VLLISSEAVLSGGVIVVAVSLFLLGFIVIICSILIGGLIDLSGFLVSGAVLGRNAVIF
jgi:hypothetical protein